MTKPPVGKRRRWQPEPAQAPRWDVREIRRLAEDGVGADDLAQVLNLQELLAAEPERRAAFEGIVAKGNAAFRVAVQRRAAQEGVAAGRATVLVTLLRAFMPGVYGESVAPPDEESGLLARVQGLFVRLEVATRARKST